MEKDNHSIIHNQHLINFLIENKAFLYSPDIVFKGHKITLALHLATDHNPTEPILASIRKVALDFFTSLFNATKLSPFSSASQIIMLLSSAGTISAISELNTQILIRELQHFLEKFTSQRFSSHVVLDRDFFQVPEYIEQKHQKDIKDIKRQPFETNISKGNSREFLKDTNSPQSTLESPRTIKILNFLKEKGPVSIREIKFVIKDVSEKTIQRELAILVDQGRVIRSGERRWSTYMIS